MLLYKFAPCCRALRRWCRPDGWMEETGGNRPRSPGLFLGYRVRSGAIPRCYGCGSAGSAVRCSAALWHGVIVFCFFRFFFF